MISSRCQYPSTRITLTPRYHHVLNNLNNQISRSGQWREERIPTSAAVGFGGNANPAVFRTTPKAVKGILVVSSFDFAAQPFLSDCNSLKPSIWPQLHDICALWHELQLRLSGSHAIESPCPGFPRSKWSLSGSRRAPGKASPLAWKPSMPSFLRPGRIRRRF